MGTLQLQSPILALELYVGRYEVSPGFILTVTREGAQVKAQATGQPEFEINAESQTEFFFKVVDARITFHIGRDGAVESLTLHQGGTETQAKRID